MIALPTLVDLAALSADDLAQLAAAKRRREQELESSRIQEEMARFEAIDGWQLVAARVVQGERESATPEAIPGWRPAVDWADHPPITAPIRTGDLEKASREMVASGLFSAELVATVMAEHVVSSGSEVTASRAAIAAGIREGLAQIPTGLRP
jgi:D-serine deaminase-like pyridoxal phosphate-dependent protein